MSDTWLEHHDTVHHTVLKKREGTGACVLGVEAGSCLSGGQDHIGGVVWGVCELNMILGSLSVNR